MLGDTLFYLGIFIPVLCGLMTVMGSIYRIQWLMIIGFVMLCAISAIAVSGTCCIIIWRGFVELLRYTLHFILKKLHII